MIKCNFVSVFQIPPFCKQWESTSSRWVYPYNIVALLKTPSPRGAHESSSFIRPMSNPISEFHSRFQYSDESYFSKD